MKTVQLFYACLGLLTIGCSHLGMKSKSVAPLKPSEQAYPLVLKPEEGRVEQHSYYAHTHVQSYESGQLVRERDEIVDFKVQTKTLKHDKEKDFIHYLVETVEKDGLVDLHDMAFPEKGERIEMVLKPNADVVYVGGYPKTSAFYIPPLSLPSKPVQVGDTWELSRSWVNLKNSIPQKIELVTILKNIYPCGQKAKELCADLEISGQVGLIAALNKQTKLTSDVSGRILFSITQGTILWHFVKTKETMSIADSQLKMKSCMVSALVMPEVDQWPGVDQKDCNPNNPKPENIPGTL